MGKYAVAYINFMDNDLIVEIIEADSTESALFKHSALESENYDYLKAIIENNIDDAKEEAFNGDWIFDVKEIC